MKQNQCIFLLILNRLPPTLYTNMNKLILIALLSLTNQLVSMAQFKMLGTSRDMGNGCIQLTPSIAYSEGLAYSHAKLDLTENFEIEFDIFLGDKEEGADGITFVIHNDERGFNAFGNWGECMGYGRFNPNYPGNSIYPSIAVEFDTYQNINQNDPASDHVAYLENGSSRHMDHWNNNDRDFNLEDNRLHNFRFRWDATKKNITVLLDGVVVYKGQKDLINQIFNGETKVIWGFTASTGRAHNLQYFCLRRLASAR